MKWDKLKHKTKMKSLLTGYARGESMRSIALRMKVDRSTIRYHLEKNNIPIRHEQKI